jgi:hypothetical protein
LREECFPDDAVCGLLVFEGLVEADFVALAGAFAVVLWCVVGVVVAVAGLVDVASLVEF